jgi:hypothetical protein
MLSEGHPDIDNAYSLRDGEAPVLRKVYGLLIQH